MSRGERTRAQPRRWRELHARRRKAGFLPATIGGAPPPAGLPPHLDVHVVGPLVAEVVLAHVGRIYKGLQREQAQVLHLRRSSACGLV